ncbi:hypothetical protein CP971_05450 [Streptomyces viridifaciens]|nr:hypothetical protein CP971_05450 [Streptomyces viridifaciens]
MTAVLRTAAHADAFVARALAGGAVSGADLDVLYPLHEELTGHLMILSAATQERYRHLPPGARMRTLADGALRVGGELLARPPHAGAFDIAVMAPVCRLLLALHQGKDAFVAVGERVEQPIENAQDAQL